MSFEDQQGNVGEGWQPLIEALHETLKGIAPNYRVIQIKEKFGGLRYYVDFPEGGTEKEMHACRVLIAAAESGSFNMCENCGKAPTPQPEDMHWLRTLCAEHWAEHRAWRKTRFES